MPQQKAISRLSSSYRKKRRKGRMRRKKMRGEKYLGERGGGSV
jgi:hypothetical protein